MKHGVAFRKFSRTSSHRDLMLRNLVTSLFEHEQIKTTLPKAKDAARIAEKIITMGKKGDDGAQARASAFLLKPTIASKLFSTLARRYASRPGGYTRIHKFGNRQGDNAPHAILELVDNPRDLKWEMTTRAVGMDLLKEKLKSKSAASVIESGLGKIVNLLKAEQRLQPEDNGVLRPLTRWNLQRALHFRGPDALKELSKRAKEYADELLATPMVSRSMHEEVGLKTPNVPMPRPFAGYKEIGDTRPALAIAQGALATASGIHKKRRIYGLASALTEEIKTQ